MAMQPYHYTYTKGWFRAHKKPLALYTPEHARSLQLDEKAYTVVVGELTQPLGFLDLNLSRGFVGVSFLDKELRVYLEYHFVKNEDRYFLSQTIQRWFEGKAETVLSSELHRFTTDGALNITTVDLPTNTEMERQSENPVDLTKNWEVSPRFGEYDGFFRKER